MRTMWRILLIALLICAFGVISIYSSTYSKEGDFWQTLFLRQILWVAMGVAVFFMMARTNYRRLWDWTYVIYGAVLFLLLLVVIMGIVRLGAQRWLRLAGFNLQPAEVAKLGIIIFLAKYFSKKSIYDVSLPTRSFGIFRGLIVPLMFVTVPAALIVDQPDLGSGALVFAIFLTMIYLSNVKFRFILIVLLVLLACVPVGWSMLRDYQKDRVMVFLNPNTDPLGAGYTAIQSKIAIGSGGLLGKGWLSGTQSQLRFLPESHTDFIFATFTEEWGFLGGAALLLLYYLLIKEGIAIAEKTADQFGRLLALGISLMLTLQVSVNIAMNMGLVPIVGLPLPLMSYGGSSVMITFIALGIVVNINRTRAVF
ncbi:MAG TPA: rod shape-determining protein RodA [Candidatus Omnitrophota bacterium]|nr:rod shape-determining protein RodA [Candidatus Omnitrophota bacterium]HRZ15271.1 rod shape-determining protein RodA [Candidatus Omnitrophota bacterium]